MILSAVLFRSETSSLTLIEKLRVFVYKVLMKTF